MDQLADYMGTLVPNATPPAPTPASDQPPALPPKQRAHRVPSGGGTLTGAQPAAPPRRQNKKSNTTVRTLIINATFTEHSNYYMIMILVLTVKAFLFFKISFQFVCSR